jgi:hypothetical protein
LHVRSARDPPLVAGRRIVAGLAKSPGVAKPAAC